MAMIDKVEKLRRTLNLLWQESFFDESKTLSQVCDEINKPALTSAEILYDWKSVETELRRMATDGILARQILIQGKFKNATYVQARKPPSRSKPL